MQGAWVRSLVGEIKSHMLCRMVQKLKKKKKERNCYITFFFIFPVSSDCIHSFKCEKVLFYFYFIVAIVV